MPTFATQPELAAKCSRYVQPSSGWTFLHQTAYFGYECGARTLIRLGALVPALSKDGETPLSVSDQRGHRNASLILESAATNAKVVWKPDDNAELLPSSSAWDEAIERWATMT